MLPLYLTEYSSAFSVGDPVHKEMTHNQLNVKKKKTFELFMGATGCILCAKELKRYSHHGIPER